MTQGKTILVGTDLTPSGARAADAAAMVARDLGLGLCLVHAHAGVPLVDPLIDPGTRPAAEQLVERLAAERERLKQALAAEQARLSASGAQVTSARLVEGSPSEVLMQEALALGARIVAVGPHARRVPVLDRFLGSTAEHVLRHAPCPVLVAPAVGDDAPRSLKGGVIVVGIDGAPASLTALATALELAADASASVEAIYAGLDASVVDRAVAWVRGRAAHANLDAVLAGVRRTPPEGSAPLALLEVARRTHAALVVVGTKGRSGLSHAVLGSVAEVVCRHSPLPVLVVRHEARG